MSKKTEEYIVLANRTADSLSQRWEHWAEFLITASLMPPPAPSMTFGSAA